MRIHLRFATDVAAHAIELKDRKSDLQARASKPVVAANDNDVAWPLIPFPEGFFAAF